MVAVIFIRCTYCYSPLDLADYDDDDDDEDDDDDDDHVRLTSFLIEKSAQRVQVAICYGRVVKN